MQILVTGGLGFIGSHVCIELAKKGWQIIIVDDCRNSYVEVYENLKKITGQNITLYRNPLSMSLLDFIFSEHSIDGVIHLAGSKSVEESIHYPLKYYRNNFLNTLELIETMKRHSINNFVFSSSATVYGSSVPPYKETDITGQGITNSYGRTKYFIEEMLKDVCQSQSSFNCTILRYFNPVGGYKGILGEHPKGNPGNLMPCILKNFDKSAPVLIFGKDYETEDGTPIRDFIHVQDLARGHVDALENMSGMKIYNLGTGNGVSVLSLVENFRKIVNEDEEELKYEFVKRREGDLPISIGNVDRAKEELNWSCEKTTEDMCRDSYIFYKNLNS